MNPSIKRFLIKLFALGLIVFCCQRSYADFFQYRAMRSLDKGRMNAGINYLERAKKSGPASIRLQYELAKAYFGFGIREKNDEAIKLSESYFHKLQPEIPFYGRFFFYAAAAQIEFYLKNKSWLQPDGESEVKLFLDEAVRLEPASANILFDSSHYLLKLNRDDALIRQQVKSYLKQVVQIEPEKFHVKVLETAWESGFGYDDFRELTPNTYRSLNRLVQFVEAKNMWKYRDNLFQEFLSIWRKDFDNNLREAEKAYTANKFKLARHYYQQALFMSKEFWMTPDIVKAKAGLFVLRSNSERISDEEIREIVSTRVDLGPLLPRVMSKIASHSEWQAFEMPLSAKTITNKESEVNKSLGDWWGEGFQKALLDRSGRIGLELELSAGRKKMSIAVLKLRHSPYLQFVLWDSKTPQWIGAKHLSDENQKSLTFEFETLGGKQWLDVLMMNGSKHASELSPMVQLGKVEIQNAA